MATKKDDGGSAFPIPSMRQSGEVSSDNHLDFEERGQSGMSLRDYFAAKAMNGFFTGIGYGVSPETIKAFVKLSYSIADTMIEERNK